MSIIEMVKQSANRTTMRHYRSEPIPTVRLFGKLESYSKPFGYAVGKPQPSIMQQAFLNAVLKG